MRLDSGTPGWCRAGVSELRVALVIMEAGARWPAGLEELQARYSRAIVESQPPGEAPSDFTRRVVRRVRGLLDAGERIDRVVLSLAPNAQPSLLACRYRMARAAVAGMTRHGVGRLVLFSEDGAPDELKHQLFAFADALFDGLRGTQVEVSVRFSSSKAGSGVQHIFPDGAPERKKLG